MIKKQQFLLFTEDSTYILDPYEDSNQNKSYEYLAIYSSLINVK